MAKKTVSYKEAIDDVIDLLVKEMNEYKASGDKCWLGGNYIGANCDNASYLTLKSMIEQVEALKSA